MRIRREKQAWTTQGRSAGDACGQDSSGRRASMNFRSCSTCFKGDMSLVGPSPERPQFVEKFKEEIPRYMIKHQVRPGLTGSGTGQWFPGRYFDPQAESTVIFIILRTGRWDWILRLLF